MAKMSTDTLIYTVFQKILKEMTTKRNKTLEFFAMYWKFMTYSTCPSYALNTVQHVSLSHVYMF